MLKVLHIYANKINFGDWAASDGVKKMLIDSYNGEMIIQDKKFFDDYSQKDVDYINKEIDFVVVGGGGLFWQKDNSIGWLWNINKDLLLKIQKPVYFFSVGLNTNVKNKKGKLTKITENNIKEIFQIKDNFFLGARDRMTYEWGKNIGIKNIFFTPCSSLFLYKNIPKDENKISNVVGINVIPREYMVRPDIIEKGLLDSISKLKIDGLKFVLIPHNSIGASEYEKKLARKFDIEIQEICDLEQLYEVYNNLLFSVVMRAHPILFSISQKTPVLPLIYNIKSLEFIKLFNHSYYIKMPNKISFSSTLISKKINEFHEIINTNKEMYENRDELMSEYEKSCVNFAKFAISNVGNLR